MSDCPDERPAQHFGGNRPWRFACACSHCTSPAGSTSVWSNKFGKINSDLYITQGAEKAYRVHERGQITIDYEARRQLGVEPGMVAYQLVPFLFPPLLRGCRVALAESVDAEQEPNLHAVHHRR